MIVVAYIAHLACLFGAGFGGSMGIRRALRGDSSGVLLIGMAVALVYIGLGVRGLAL